MDADERPVVFAGMGIGQFTHAVKSIKDFITVAGGVDCERTLERSGDGDLHIAFIRKRADGVKAVAKTVATISSKGVILSYEGLLPAEDGDVPPRARIENMMELQAFLVRRLAANLAICDLVLQASHFIHGVARRAWADDEDKLARIKDVEVDIVQAHGGLHGHLVIHGYGDRHVVLRLNHHDKLVVHCNGELMHGVGTIIDDPYTPEALARGDAEGDATADARVLVGRLIAHLGLVDAIATRLKEVPAAVLQGLHAGTQQAPAEMRTSHRRAHTHTREHNIRPSLVEATAARAPSRDRGGAI